MQSSDYDKAKELWDSFCENVRFKQRFFISHPVLEMLARIAKSLVKTIEPGQMYYRARIIDEKAARKEHMIAKCYREDASEEERQWYRNKANRFRGLCKEGSYVPPYPKYISDAL